MTTKKSANIKNTTINPFLKWAGGKRWLVKSFPSFFDFEFNRYIEPFIGSGAVFFYLNPQQAILSDTNAMLIETYQAIKDDWEKVQKNLKKHQDSHCKDYYYKIRDEEFDSPYDRASKFIYLNRTCWNGLFRVNKAGQFNVPIGTKNIVLRDTDDFQSISELLKTTKLIACDCNETIEMAMKDDFLYVDPPYTVKHDKNAFIKYNERLFTWEDQLKLRDSLIRAQQRGAKIIVTNANHSSVKDIYKENFSLNILNRNSVLAGKKEFRGKVQELLIMG